ncbi:metallophosphoesterase [Paenibacillus apiarius]|uniref:Metallophosphoesterase n=2 Tax=Paenibacillus apiarius TaxID=46240 RepID=A0ABT4DLU6_9BACL|nr:metallophosphoesterase [Paenibacillus apiarius]MCY9517732.1 metallophosphoesterase [Paenibacillus apiarius]MCY9518332.1 metallophosphoesterase [Paenibacillus apiarius]MCY9551267.1 metallophosphoesterase [Paenibacillus apiarius]MCY9558421.1 metallophosphoesterase [Paenibacillus apiarius]MCY9721483.1 metallophosphoesterase [Paenibacillus apiarius]
MRDVRLLEIDARLPERWKHTAHHRAIRLHYDFRGMPGTSAVYIKPNLPEQWNIKGRPARIGCWIHAGPCGHWMRAVIIDGDGAEKPLDLTAPRGMNMSGWTFVAADLPGSLKLPLRLQQIYMVETDAACKGRGCIDVRDLCAEYGPKYEDWTGPVWSDYSPPPDAVVYQADATVSLRIMDEESGIDPASIVMSIDEQAVLHQYNEAAGCISAHAWQLEQGVHHICVAATDRAGNPANPSARWSFTTDLSPDASAPDMAVLMPMNGIVTRTLRPRIAARIKDMHSGVDESSIRMELNGSSVPVRYVHDTAYYTPEAPLPAESLHTVKVSASDMANNSKELKWSFRTGSAMAEPAPGEPYEVTIIGDGGYLNADAAVNDCDLQLQENIRRIRQEPSKLMLYTGDIVEHDTEDNYRLAVERMNDFPMPYVMAIGNHEISGTNRRDHYQMAFGETNYALDFGNLTVIGLDTASGHITSSDASQWQWLAEMLETAKGQHLILLMHVPPDEVDADGHDHLSGHGFMDKTEADRLYELLTAAKSQRRPGEIIVLCGDFHAYMSKTVGGVRYIVSGGGGKLTHIPPGQGGFYHYIQMRVHGDRIDWNVIPLLERITWEHADDTVNLRIGERLRLRAIGTFVTHGLPDMQLGIAEPLHFVWNSSNPEAVQVAPDGVVAGCAAGEASVTVECGWRSASMRVRVHA